MEMEALVIIGALPRKRCELQGACSSRFAGSRGG